MKYNYQLDALEKLTPAGFKKQRELFFLIREPDIMVLYRKFKKTGKETFYLAFTHTFFSNVMSKTGKYLLPPLLEYYPVSVATGELISQFSKHTSIQNFDCELHYLSREINAAQTDAGNSGFSVMPLLKKLFSSKISGAETSNPVDITLQEGLRFFEQFSPEFSCQVLRNNTSLHNSILNEQLAQCEKYLNRPH